MKIQLVKYHGDNLLLNDSIIVPQDNSNRYYKEIRKWLEKGNDIEPEFTEEDLLNKKKQEIKQLIEKQYQNNIQKPINFNNNIFQADSKSQDMITKVIISASDDFETDWLDINNKFIHFKLEDLKMMANSILQRGQQEFAKKVQLKKQIDNCKTLDELNSIKLGVNDE